MKFLFLNEAGKVRSGWRAAAFLLTFLFLAVLFIFAEMTVLLLPPMGPSAGSCLPLVIPFGISSPIEIVLGWLYGKLFEELPFRALGCSFRGNWLGHFSIGCLVGAVALASAIIVAVM